MTWGEYTRTPLRDLKGRHVRALRRLASAAGVVFDVGQELMIDDKRAGFTLVDGGGRRIRRVQPTDVELVDA